MGKIINDSPSHKERVRLRAKIEDFQKALEKTVTDREIASLCEFPSDYPLEDGDCDFCHARHLCAAYKTSFNP